MMRLKLQSILAVTINQNVFGTSSHDSLIERKEEHVVIDESNEWHHNK